MHTLVVEPGRPVVLTVRCTRQNTQRKEQSAGLPLCREQIGHGYHRMPVAIIPGGTKPGRLTSGITRYAWYAVNQQQKWITSHLTKAI